MAKNPACKKWSTGGEWIHWRTFHPCFGRTIALMINSKRTVVLWEQRTLAHSLGGVRSHFLNHVAIRTLHQTRILALVSVLIAWAVVGGVSCAAQTLAEALDTTNLVWTTGGDVPWFA